MAGRTPTIRSLPTPDPTRGRTFPPVVGHPGHVTSIVRIDEDDWAVLGELRLRALRTDPAAFGSSLEREESFREQHWRMRLRSSPWFVARDKRAPGAPPFGLVCLIEEPASPADDRHVVALWVEAARRREGVGSALLAAAARAASDAGSRTLSLWVADDNDVAIALYVRAGFTPTGERQRLPRDPSRFESRYARKLA